MDISDTFTKDDFRLVKKYISSLQERLLRKGISIEYLLEQFSQGKDGPTEYCAYIDIPIIQKDPKFKYLFSEDYSLFYVSFVKDVDMFASNTELHLGDGPGNYPMDELVEDGESWKLSENKYLQDDSYVLSVFRKLSKDTIGHDLREIDVRLMPGDEINYKPYPALAHDFDVDCPDTEFDSYPRRDPPYMESVLYFPEETTENLRSLNLELHIERFYNSFMLFKNNSS